MWPVVSKFVRELDAEQAVLVAERDRDRADGRGRRRVVGFHIWTRPSSSM